MDEERTRDEELDEIAGLFEDAGLIEITTEPDGATAFTLTHDGQRLANRLALAGGEDGLLNAGRYRGRAGIPHAIS